MDEARDVPSSGDQMFRLRAGDIHFSGGKIRDCLRPSGGVYPRCNYDEYDAARDAREHYDATGVFFGANSEYLAIRFVLGVDIPERHKSWSKVDGLVIMRAQP
ncbi:MAG: hypothetical protein JWR40_2631 [Massilia sp.]|jgi:hypothetical protein|nr:hypothetical protein [Massilia sp.]